MEDGVSFAAVVPSTCSTGEPSARCTRTSRPVGPAGVGLPGGAKFNSAPPLHVAGGRTGPGLLFPDNTDLEEVATTKGDPASVQRRPPTPAPAPSPGVGGSLPQVPCFLTSHSVLC